jgi:RNA binding exosome subunit
MKEIEVNVYSIIGNSFCVDAEDGEKVFEALKKILEQNNNAVISFLNVEMLTSAFLNTAVGRLYGLFDHEKIKSSLSLKDISDDDKLLLKKVTDTAKAYYKNKKGVEAMEAEILGE